MLYEFIITIKNISTGEETKRRMCTPISAGYFEAWNSAISEAKTILESENNKYLFVSSIENLSNA